MNKKYGISALICCFLSIIILSFNIKYVGAQMHETLIPEGNNGNTWSTPAVVMYGSDDIYSKYIDTKYSEETYSPDSRKYQGIATIEKIGNRIWAAWMVGGEWECRYNYIVLAYSDDNGKKWVDPYIIIDHPDTANQGVAPIIPLLWQDLEGNLWLYYQQFGVWAIKFNDAGNEDITKVTYSQPKRIIEGWSVGKPPVPIRKSDGSVEWLMSCEKAHYGLSNTPIFRSTDNGNTWTQIANPQSVRRKLWGETQIVQVSNNELWLISRLEKQDGGVEVAKSFDYGKTWTEFSQEGISIPITGPGTKIHAERLNSGNILVVNNDSLTHRVDLTAFLSTDNGETWSKLLLDNRNEVAYPEISVDGDIIYIVYDYNRFPYSDIRISAITEQDILTGELVSENSYLKRLVSQKGIYSDIVEVSVGKTVEVARGSTVGQVIDILGNKLYIRDSKGVTHEITGIWEYPKDFDGTKVGNKYIFNFKSDLPKNVIDEQRMLSFKIVIVEKGQDNGKSSCSSAINLKDMSAFLCSTSVLLAIIVFTISIRNKKSKKN